MNSYDAVNAQVSFTLLSKYLTFKVGASNIFGIIPFFEEGQPQSPLRMHSTTDKCKFTVDQLSGEWPISQSYSSGIDR